MKSKQIWRIVTSAVIVPDAFQRDTGLPGDPQGRYNLGFASTKKALMPLAKLDRLQGGSSTIERSTVDELRLEYGCDAEAWIENEIFQENYGLRPNGPNARDTLNHGIYSKDLNGDYLERLTAEMIAERGIVLEVEERDEE